MKTQWAIGKARIKEWLVFDSVVFGTSLRVLLGLAGVMFFRTGRTALAFRLMSMVHRAGQPAFLSRYIHSLMRGAFQSQSTVRSRPFDSYLKLHIQNAAEQSPPSLVANPEKMLPSMAIVLAAAKPSQRGVLALNYNYAFPLFINKFDVASIAQRYHIVLEPSWSGYCTEDVLCCNLLRPETVFVQAFEPRDADFINGLNANFVCVPTSTNWWVDHRVFSPEPRVPKDLDFVMAASWADFKRHHRFFAVLRKLRRRGHVLRGACIGYPRGLTLDEIKARAEHYGVADQIEFHEFIPQTEVAQLMRRAKVNVVWSRKEGVNRVIIEGMFCDVPCLLPDGFNYGYRYPYVNEQTGCWSSQTRLEDDLVKMTQSPWPHSPAEWVTARMTAQHATEILQQAIRGHCQATDQHEPERLAVKIDGLHGMEYWDTCERECFAEDYDFLRSNIYTGS